jgi:hypothetical protein
MLFFGSSLLYKEGANKTLKINSFQPTLSQNMCLFDLKTIFGSFCEAKWVFLGGLLHKCCTSFKVETSFNFK